MPAGVVAQVEDEAVAGHLEAQVAVQLGPARAHHVGHVQVAEAPAGALAGERPSVGDPRLIAQRRLVGERGDDDGAPFAAGPLDRQGDRFAGGVGEVLGGPPAGVDRTAVDGDDRIAGRHGDPRSGQRRAGPRVGRLARQDPLDAPVPVLSGTTSAPSIP